MISGYMESMAILDGIIGFITTVVIFLFILTVLRRLLLHVAFVWCLEMLQ